MISYRRVTERSTITDGPNSLSIEKLPLTLISLEQSVIISNWVVISLQLIQNPSKNFKYKLKIKSRWLHLIEINSLNDRIFTHFGIGVPYASNLLVWPRTNSDKDEHF